MSIQTKNASFSQARDVLIAILQTLVFEEKISQSTYNTLHSKIIIMNNGNITIDDVITEISQRGEEYEEKDINHALYGKKFKQFTLNKYLIKLHTL